MKVLIFLILIIAAINCDYYVNDQRIIDEVNNDPASSWKAGENEVFRGKTLVQIKKMLGAFLIPKNERPTRKINVAPDFLPQHFDAREQWPSCVHSIRDQAQCGSCWAFAGSEVLSDRMCIATKGEVNKVLSPQDMVSCDKADFGCQGGYLDKLWDYMVETGIVTDACFPYVSMQGKVPPCPFDTKKECVTKSEPYKKYFAKDIDHFDDIESAMTDIMTYGPILAGFKVYRDFFNYKSGVYYHKTGSLAGGHAIKIVGWGVDTASGLDYWAVANSWGESWGMKGYFWIKKGVDECEIELNLWTGHADPKN